MHGAGNIDHKQVFARADGLGGNVFGRLDHGQKKVLATAGRAAAARRALIQHHARLNPVTGQPVIQNEVAVVAAAAAGLQRHRSVRGVIHFYVNRVRAGMHFLDANRRGQRHLDVKRRGRGFARAQVRLADPAGAGLAGLRAVVARPDHGGKNKLVLARLRHQQLGVAQLDLNVVAGQDVGDIHLEHIGQLLLQQGGGLAFFFGVFVGNAGLLLFADLGRNQPVGQPHVHAVNRRAGRARKHIARFNGALAFVFVALGHGDIGNHARNPHVHLR